MNRRGNSVLLIPLLAALALFYPGATRKSSPGSSHNLTAAVEGTSSRQGGTRQEEWTRGRKAVQWFFGRPPEGKTSDGGNNPRTNATLQFLIVTVPDPIDSGLPHMFDRYMASVQAAVQTQPYFLYRFDLPWQDCLSKGKDKDNKASEDDSTDESKDESQEKACKERRFAKEPGFLLLTNPTGTSATEEGKPDKSKIDLLLVYLIGETPTSGIHKWALNTALKEISWFCGWREDEKDPPAPDLWPSAACKDGIRILGPSYSGSAQSLDLALSSWLDSIGPVKPAVTMISGSATAIRNRGDPKETDFYHTRSRLKSDFSFRSMELPDNVAEAEFCDYLKSRARALPVKVAMLSEAGTVYGRREPVRDSSPKRGCDVGIERTKIPFPLHISQLRAASEKLRQTQQETTPQPQIPNNTLPLAESLEDAGTRRDIPAFSRADALTAEQVVAQLVSTISREGYNYVGITATDVRDTMFLAQEVREHSPRSVLFTFSSDLLFLHPEVNSSLRGMLVVSSYPLTNSNQLWSLPSEPGLRRQFADDGSEGVYNATLALLGGEEHMLEYSMPFIGDRYSISEPVRPPIWITVVGRNRLWPVETHDVASDPRVKGYTYELACDRVGSIDQNSWRSGLYPEATLVFAAVFALLCIAFCLPLLRRPQRRSDDLQAVRIAGLRGATETSAPWWRRRWLDRALGEAVCEKHRRAGELCLLAGCASLGTFLTVLGTALFVPAGIMKRLGLSFWKMPEGLVLFGVAFTAILLAAGTVSLLVALRPRQKNRRSSDQANRLSAQAWSPIVVGCLAVIALALLLSWSWISPAWKSKNDVPAALFTSLRSLELWRGVSALLPLFLICMAGFLWAVSSFHRIRQLDDFESEAGFLTFGQLGLGEVQGLERRLRSMLSGPSLQLPFAKLVLILAIAANVYLWWKIVPSLENGFFYGLLAVSLFFVGLGLWFGVLRFWCAWQETRHLLGHLALLPLQPACKRFRESFPALSRISVAAPSAVALAHLECSVTQARTLWLRAKSLVQSGYVQLKIVGSAVPTQVTVSGNAAWLSLSSADIAMQVQDAATYLVLARKADADRRWRDVVTWQWESRGALSSVAAEVASILQNSWWTETREASKNTSDTSTTTPERVFELGEEFLVGRVAHFLACVFPQLQNLIFTSVAGLLLLLFAVSCYPFRPYNLLLLFSWVVILSVVGIALWVFIQMNRDPILSFLNGTKPGKINWDWEFGFRVFLYGVVPILALLGAQFPQSVGQILSYLVPGEAMHH